MEILGFDISKLFRAKPAPRQEQTSKPQASFGVLTRSYNILYDGEKSPGEVGPIINWQVEYYSLALRSWQAYLESEIAKTIIDRYVIWVIDKGLKLQANPETSILESSNISLDKEKFNTSVEAHFKIWANSKKSSFNGEETFNEQQRTAFINASIAGDVLVILRLVDGTPKSEIVDGERVRSPFGIPPDEGNTIRNGIEMDSKGTHIRYFVWDTEGFTYKVVPAYSSTAKGLRTAFMYYGSKYRIANNRGLPRIASCLETLKKIERYKEAAVGSAEERQKLAYTIVHQQYSDGENPYTKELKARIVGSEEDKATGDELSGQVLESAILKTYGKQVVNMPIGAELKALDSKNEMFFAEFFDKNAFVACAAVGIPPNVAFSLYNDSFSASRAATKDWDHTIEWERSNAKKQFLDHVYKFWFHATVITRGVVAPGYLRAFVNGRWQVQEAYTTCRFIGPMFPHIDPMKEVNAERAKLGPLGAHLPMTTLDEATEKLTGGDSRANIQRFAEELSMAESEGVEPVQSNVVGDTSNGNTD